MLDCLEGQQWFSTLDMGKAYHQGYIHPDSRKYTAFTTPWSLYEWIRIPYSLTNAPPCFQHYINETVEGLRDLKFLAYLKNILVYGKTFDEQLENLEAVLMKLKLKGIKLNVSKYNFYKQKVNHQKTTKNCWRTSFTFGFTRVLSGSCEKLFNYLKTTLWSFKSCKQFTRNKSTQ